MREYQHLRVFDLCSLGGSASVLAFGCAPMMGFCDRAKSLRALETAWDCNINFFDLARSYGYGQAESLFAGFARGRRDRLFIATKFGIEPEGSIRANAIRLLRGGFGGLRHLRWTKSEAPDRDHAFSRYWSPARLRSGVEDSLRELRTDYIDLLFLHSPPADITCRRELFEALDRLVSEGLIRSYGLSTDCQRAAFALAHARYTIRAVQYPYCAAAGKTDVLTDSPGTVIVNHVFGGRGTLRSATAWIEILDQSNILPSETKRKLRSGDAAAILADVLINAAFSAAVAQCVVVSMFRPDHIIENCRTVVEGSRFAPAELSLIDQALRLSQPAISG